MTHMDEDKQGQDMYIQQHIQNTWRKWKLQLTIKKITGMGHTITNTKTITYILSSPMYLYDLQKEICTSSSEMKIIFIPHLIDVIKR